MTFSSGRSGRSYPVAFALGVVLVAGARANATTWGVPGNNSNTCTVAVPSCNTIAQAVTASTSGDTINVGAGTFAAAAIALTKSLTIAGTGIGTTIVQPTSSAFSIRTSNIVIRDMTLQNGTAGIAFQSVTSNNTQITRVQFTGQTSRGIDMQLAATVPISNIQIADCSFSTASAIGIRMSSTSQVTNLTVTGSTFSGNGYGIYQANDGSTSRLTGLTIQNTHFTNNTNYGIYAEEVRDALIEDSFFTGGAVGIGLLKFYASNGVAMSNVTIRRNQFSGFKANALDIEMYGFGLETGLTVEANTIQKDVAISTSAASIFLRLHPTLTNATATFQDNTITASGIFGAATSAHAIQLQGNGPVNVTGNVLDGGNVGGTGTTPPSSGLFIQSRSGSTVMPATTSISSSCNRIQGFHNGVSVFDSFAGTYGGLTAGATITIASNAILGNDDGVVSGSASPTIDAEDNYWGCPAGPGNAGCDDAVGNVDADPFQITIPACVDCLANSECDDGAFCTGAETCNVGSGQCVPSSDPCVGGAACDNLCNEAADNCAVPNGTVCRAAAGACDVAETCTGAGGGCPADGFVTGGTECRAAGGICDVAESCTGLGPNCPADGFVANGTPCRAAAGVCDVGENCDGASVACPADAVATASVVCRSSAGICDAAENCDGAGVDCPADGFASAATVCRPSAGACDVAENCTGTGTACPADAFQSSSTVCRAAAGACDVAENCSGGSATCPIDAKSTAVCRAAAGTCDIAESCDGASDTCPADAFKPNGASCDDGDVCGIADSCNGSGMCVSGGGPDGDNDTVCDASDNCPTVANPGQEDLDADGIGNVCDPDDGPLNPTKVKFRTFIPGGTDTSYVNFKGDFVTLAVNDTFSASAGITVTLSDGNPTPSSRSRTFVPAECTSGFGGTRITCKTADRLAKVRFKSSPRAQTIWKFSGKLKKLALPGPLVGPAKMVLTYGAAIDRVGVVQDCQTSFSGLSCRQQH